MFILGILVGAAVCFVVIAFTAGFIQGWFAPNPKSLPDKVEIAKLEAAQGIPVLTAGECRGCKKPLVAGAKFCTYCKTTVIPEPNLCPVCQTRNPEDAIYCCECGTDIGRVLRERQRQRKIEELMGSK